MTDALADWRRRSGRQSEGAAAAATAEAPPAPGDLRAEAGAGHVTLRWSQVTDACGYLVERAAAAEGPFAAVDHGGGDVLAVPGPPYTDTTGPAGARRWYRVCTVADLGQPPSPPSPAVSAAPLPAAAAPPVVTVDLRTQRSAGRLRRLWHMIGSERLSQLTEPGASGGRPIGAEFAAALRMAREDLGVERVRAHAILHDDLGVYAETVDGPRYDFSRVDAVYDAVLALGLRPVVELSFMPAALASDPGATVFDYRAVVSPPRDWAGWGELCGALAAHLVRRYGLDEVAGWGFEVWNEPNLEVFWSGDQDDYLRLYETAARAVKAVDARLLVGGPASAAAGWIADFLDAVCDRSLPLDFLSTHTYGNLPLDVRGALAVRDLDEVAVWWTEWGVTPRHFAAVTDGPFGAPFLLSGMKRAQSSADALAYWVVSDHFEELGRPPGLLHGGFGLLTVGNLRKPRWWALRLAEELGDDLCDVALSGDGAGGLVDAWASRTPDGRIDLLAWNGTLDQSKALGDLALDRRLLVRVDGLDAASYRVTCARVDGGHANIAAHADAGRDWPDEAGWAALRAADHLHVEDLGAAEPADGTLSFAFDLPMPGVARLRLDPA